MVFRGVVRGANPPPWTSEIYGFHGVFRHQRRLLSPQPGQIHELAPVWLLWVIVRGQKRRVCVFVPKECIDEPKACTVGIYSK